MPREGTWTILRGLPLQSQTSHQLLFARFPAASPALGNISPGMAPPAPVPQFLFAYLQPWTCSLPTSFSPNAARTLPSADHFAFNISPLARGQWLSVGSLKVSDCAAHRESCSTGEAAKSIQNMSGESAFAQEGEGRCQCRSLNKTMTVSVLVVQIP